MNVVLVNPRIPPAAMNFQLAMELVDARFAHIPLGLATLAALTPPEHHVRIVDECVEDVDVDTIARGADLVALTGIYCQDGRLFQLADAFRERGVRVAIGGPIAEDREADVLAHCDHLFIGEAEEVWPPFFDDLASGVPKSVYRQKRLADMSRSPMPRYDLLRVERYSSACVQATRGCPYRCEFCDVPTKLGQRPRTKTVAQVVAEVRALHGLGFESVFFVDDMFIGNRRYAKQLLQALAELRAELGGGLYFYTQVTLNVARDPELLHLFKAANFTRFFVGIETSDVPQLRAMQKTQNVELDIYAAIEAIQREGITVWAGIIIGLDDDTAATFAAQRRFIAETGIIPTLIGLLQAMPGAPLWERARREGRVLELPTVVGSAAYGTSEALGTTNLAPVGFTVPALMRYYADFVESIYDPDFFTELLLTAHRRHQPPYRKVWNLLNVRTAKVLRKVLSWYVTHSDPRVRRMPRRLIGAFLTGKVPHLDELAFHLALYRHLSVFYADAAESARRAAERLVAA